MLHAIVMRGCACGTLGALRARGRGASAVGLPRCFLLIAALGRLPVGLMLEQLLQHGGYLRSSEVTEVSPALPSLVCAPWRRPTQSWGGVGEGRQGEVKGPEMEAGLQAATRSHFPVRMLGAWPIAGEGGLGRLAGSAERQCGAAAVHSPEGLPGGRILAARVEAGLEGEVSGPKESGGRGLWLSQDRALGWTPSLSWSMGALEFPGPDRWL